MSDDSSRLVPSLTPTDATDSTGALSALPDDVLRETSRRLALFCAIGIGVWTVSLVLLNTLLPAGSPEPFPWPGNLIGGAVIAVLLGTWVYLERGGCQSPIALDLGLVVLVVCAFAVALLSSWVTIPTDLSRVSRIAALILVFSITAPSTPRRTFVACLVAASMDSLAAAFARARGVAVPSLPVLVLLYFPNYVAAIVAVLPPLLLHRLGRRIQRARDLGSYRLIDLLGRGGMGEVWRAEHRLLARPAAIKLVRPEVIGHGADREASLTLRRFEREAHATAALSSPHTINLFDFGSTEQGTFYYVMELLMGRDLESLVREFGPLPPGRTVHLLRQVCQSLAEAHVKGLIHRDVKPANIYLCRVGLEYDFVKVLDFGLVKFRGRTDLGLDTLATARDVTSGTPAYMAPEIILGRTTIDTRADVYAFGCVAYWLLTGKRVFESESVMQMLMDHAQRIPEPPSRQTELQIPRELDDLVLACLDKNPDKRPQNGEALWKLTEACQIADSWNQHAARNWWEMHLPELTEPVVLGGPAPRANRASITPS